MKYLVTLFVILSIGASYDLNVFYCGFSGDYCGQSNIDDVYPSARFVILAFANTLPSGAVVCDDDHFPATVVTSWKKNGKKVVISVGGQNGNWAYVFASPDSRKNFIDSLVKIVSKYKLDGVDLDIESYLATPRTVAQTIIDLKTQLSKLGKKVLILSPQCVGVNQAAPVPGPDSPGQPFNYFVPIISLADSSIDYYQVQAYNNWFDGFAGGSLEYYKDVYLNWRNLQGLSPWGKPLENFSGVSGKKLLIGLLASTQAGGANYYGRPETIQAFIQFIEGQKYPLAGFMMWDSHWDQLNNNAISKAIKG